MQIKGKKLSVTQRNILRKALFEDKITADLDNFLLKKIKHVSADGQDLIWPMLMKKFTEKGVNIYCASESSKFKKYAKIWQQ